MHLSLPETFRLLSRLPEPAKTLACEVIDTFERAETLWWVEVLALPLPMPGAVYETL